MEYSDFKNSSRTAISTAEIDEKNFNAVSDISEIATQQLKDFDQIYKTQATSQESYKKFREEIEGMTESQTKAEIDIDLGLDEFMPSLREKTEKKEVVEEKVAFSLSFKGKLLIAVCSSIMALLGILLIYNAVLIGSYNTQIAAGYETLAEMEDISTELVKELNTMETSVEFMPEGLGMSQNSDVITLNTIERQQKVQYLEETNWFDSICEFISNIFGG